jgi:thiamine biosynthesis lipoprotein
MFTNQGLKARLLFLFAIGIAAGCARTGEIEQFDGNTWGTTYHVTYVSAGDDSRRTAHAAQELLTDINQSLSLFIDTSVISRVNASMDTTEWQPVDVHFAKVFRAARLAYDDTGGALNPAVGPLVNAWGFGPDGPTALPDDTTIKSLRALASFDAFDLRESPPAVRKRLAGAQLDFNAIAEGYAVDAIGAMLEQAGIKNYVIELSGEVRARGKRPDGSPWRVGIEKPSVKGSDREIQTVVSLNNAGLATSGNYRKRRTQDGKTVAHIVNPRTGYPALNSLMSVSVLAADAMTANSYSTAFVVMGLDESLHFLESHPQIHAYFIAMDPEGNIIEKRSPGFPDPNP